jgi:3-deoxy-D-manno-octulosonic-acid transferase
LVLMETELWPNLISRCARDCVPVILANARLSERSAKSYARAKKLSQSMLEGLSHIAAQSGADASRFIGLGADPARISVTGSLKFYVAEKESGSQGDEQLASIDASGRWVILAASTREGEEEKILTAYKVVSNAIDSCLLLLVPRHPERFEAVAKLCQAHGFRLCRRSSGEPLKPGHRVFLGDSMGEMARYISLADVAFVGGSLVDTGCQSVLEPAAAGKAVITGPSQFNFAAICQALEEAEGMITVANEHELAQALIGLHADQDRLRSMGVAASGFVERNRQALPKLQALIAERLEQ